MTRILIVAGSMHLGGVENQLMHLLRNADKSKFQIDYTSTMPDAYYREEIERLGGRYIQIPPMDWHNPAKYCKALLRVMQEGKYDVVHSHEAFHTGITLFLADRAGVPCRFAHSHSWRDDDGETTGTHMVRRIYHMVMRQLINRYSTVQIACSSWAGRFLYGERMQNKPSYHLVFNSVDTSAFLEEYGKREDDDCCGDGWITALHVGRLCTVKNQLFLVEIANELRKRGRRIRILCAGNGDEDYEKIVRKRIDEQALEEYIQLLGPRKDVAELMRNASVFLLPSHYEGMPLVMIEAQASGLPCVSANTYSPEVDYGVGLIRWLSLEDGVAVWADALEAAVQKERPPREIIQQAIREKGFDAKLFAEKICALYQEDMARQGCKI